MTNNNDHIFLTPSNVVRQRPTRESKDKANIKISMTPDYFSNLTKSTKIARSKSTIVPKSSNIRRAQSQVITKSNRTTLTHLEKSIDEISLDDLSDNDDSSNSVSEFSDSSDDDVDVSSESSDESNKPVTKLNKAMPIISRAKSIVKGRKSISVPCRNRASGKGDSLAQIRLKLHVGTTPEDLPCRDNEFDQIFNFLYDNLCRAVSGCMLISGQPGTGKTATVNNAIACLEGASHTELPVFKKVFINAMHVVEPRQVYSLIYQELTQMRISLKNAAIGLEKELFEGAHRRAPVLIVIDEIDQLYTNNQDVLYKIFSWVKIKASRLVLITISNTMDLAERVMHNRVSSRAGLTRLVFDAYSYQQLVEIITTRLTKEEMQASFDPKAVELAARKVAALSGDARRALDICRRALELQENGKKVDVAAINAIITEMYSTPLIVAIKCCCSFYEKLLLRAIVATFRSNGLEEASLRDVIVQLSTICNEENVRLPHDKELFKMVIELGAYKLLIFDDIRNDIHLKLRLNCKPLDVSFALDNA